MHFVTTRLGKKPDVESSGQKLTWVQSPPSNAICAEFRADSMRVEYLAMRDAIFNSDRIVQRIRRVLDAAQSTNQD